MRRVGSLLLVAASLLLFMGAAPREQVLQSARVRAESDVADEVKPESFTELKSVYEAEIARATVTGSEIDSAYRAAYRAAVKKKEQRSWWQKLTPEGGWIFGALSLLALIFKDELKRVLTRFIDGIKTFVYVRLAGTRMFRTIALSKYRRAVKAKHARITLPFRPDRPLDMEKVFVPLRLKSGIDAELIDAGSCIREKRRLMVVGMPGAGKSMLLKNLAWRYSREGLGPGTDVVPVLIELSRFNDSSRSVEEMIVDAFARNDFPRANVFVEAALNNGSLMVLFDGLDEVNSAKRQSVAATVTDFLDRYEECRAVITCRTAVYNNQFLSSVELTLEVAEFSDQQVRTFLTAWGEHMPDGKSVEQLMQTLVKRPTIMLLARNPLLLTIIAFLYSDTDFALPHSRSQFYAKAMDVLLDQWNVTQNRYSAAQKSMVLRHLALKNQDAPNESDRRTMEMTIALREIKSVLPRLNLGDDQAEPILKEIVERSGLLMLIDAGERCQFAHLTLQEFMAATALRDDSLGLVGRFNKDPDAWREVVKLWCGLDVNSTSVVEEIHKSDPVTAFECLADTLSVDTDVADRIISGFCDNFGKDDREAVARAFAAVASSTRPRGQVLFKFLAQNLRFANTAERDYAASVLASTNLPAAAELLVNALRTSVLHVIARMGDIATPVIIDSGLQANLKLELLWQIGTPAAVCGIVPYLWSSASEGLAAAFIVSLLPAAGVEAALDSLTLTSEQRSAQHFPAAWKPFGDHDTSSLAAIVNRAAYLIGSNPVELPDVELDPRVATPLMIAQSERELPHFAELMKAVDIEGWLRTIGRSNDPRLEGAKTLNDRFKVLLRILSDEDDDAIRQNRGPFIHEILKENPGLLALARRTRERHCARLLSRLFGDPKPLMSDWKSILEPVDYQLADGWHLRAVATLFILTAASAFLQFLQTGAALPWKVVAGIFLAGFAGLLFWPFKENVDVRMSVLSLLALLPVAIVLAFITIPEHVNERRMKKERLTVGLGEALGFFSMLLVLGLIGVALWGSILWMSHLFLSSRTTPPTAVGLLLGAIALAAGLTFVGRQRDRAARNPLRGLLSPEDEPFPGAAAKLMMKSLIKTPS